MLLRSSFTVLILLVIEAYTAPQFITYKDGKLGVNFGGYHAAVGLGGFLGGDATQGGLFAEAGTPFGPAAKAGLGGSVDGNGKANGGLYAGATAGGNVKAEAGLGGDVGGEKAAGAGFANAQAGGHSASSSLGGESTSTGSSGFSISKTKSYVPVETIKHKKIHNEIIVDAVNEIEPLRVNAIEAIEADAKVESEPAVIVKEVYLEPKPKQSNFQKTAYFGGFIGAGANLGGSSTVYKSVEPTINKRIDIGSESSANVGATGSIIGNGGGIYTKEVSVKSNPTLFQDIFDIPISALQAVGKLLTNVAGSTNVSVQKSTKGGAYISI